MRDEESGKMHIGEDKGKTYFEDLLTFPSKPLLKIANLEKEHRGSTTVAEVHFPLPLTQLENVGRVARVVVRLDPLTWVPKRVNSS